MTSKTHISSFQLFFVLIHVQIGVGVISLPFSVFLKASVDSWISVLATGMIIQIFILLYAALMRRFPSQNLFGIFRSIFGNTIGKAFTIVYCILYIFIASITLAKYVYVLKIWMLPHTPRWVLLALMCVTIILIVKDNLQIIARFAVLSSLTFVAFILASLYSLKYANVTFILPIGSSGMMSIIEGIPPSLFAFQGFEFLLIMYPFIRAPHKDIRRVATYANVFVTFFYSALVITSILFFSAEELKLVPQPVLYLLKAFSTRIIERPDLIFTALWIILVTTTLIIVVYTASLALMTIKSSKANNLRIYAIFVAFICFLGALRLNDIYFVRKLGKVQDYGIVPFLWGVPIILLILSYLFNKKEKVNSE